MDMNLVLSRPVNLYLNPGSDLGVKLRNAKAKLSLT